MLFCFVMGMMGLLVMKRLINFFIIIIPIIYNNNNNNKSKPSSANPKKELNEKNEKSKFSLKEKENVPVNNEG